MSCLSSKAVNPCWAPLSLHLKRTAGCLAKTSSNCSILSRKQTKRNRETARRGKQNKWMIPWYRYIFQHCPTSETVGFCEVRLSASVLLQLFLLFLALFPAVNSSIWCICPTWCTEMSVPLFLSIPVNIELSGLGNNWVYFGELPCQGKHLKLHLATSVSLQV